jgi:hypothetical protein
LIHRVVEQNNEMQSLTGNVDALHVEDMEITSRLQNAQCTEVRDGEERIQRGYRLDFELGTSQGIIVDSRWKSPG